MGSELIVLRGKMSDLTIADLDAVLAERDACAARGDRQGYGWSLLVLEHVVKWVKSDNDEPPFQRAASLASEAEAVFREVGDERGLFEALRLASPFVGREAKEAKLEEAMLIAEKLAEPRLIADALHAEAKLHAFYDKPRATELARQALAIYEELGENSRMAWCLFSLGLSVPKPENFDCFKRSGDIFVSLGRYSDAVKSFLCAVTFAAKETDIEAKRQVAMTALECAQKVGDFKKEALCYNQLAKIHRKLGRRAEARKYQRWHDEIEGSDGLSKEERAAELESGKRTFEGMAKAMGVKLPKE